MNYSSFTDAIIYNSFTQFIKSPTRCNKVDLLNIFTDNIFLIQLIYLTIPLNVQLINLFPLKELPHSNILYQRKYMDLKIKSNHYLINY